MTSDRNIIIVIIIIFITPKWSKIGPKIDPKMASKMTPKETPKKRRPQGATKTPPKRPQDDPRRLQDAPRHPKTPQDDSKTPPRRLQFFFGGVWMGLGGVLGRLRCVLEALWRITKKYKKTSGFLVVWESPMSESTEKP